MGGGSIPVSERPFRGKANKPDAAALMVALGPAFAFYRDLTQVCDGFEQEWTHTQGSGWTLKVADRNKALCYVIPLEGSLRVSMAIRESERAALLRSEHMADYRALLLSARRFAEGYSVVFDVAEASAYGYCREFVRRIIEERR
jgi:hypothetical protein